jgi:hypothetical protein
MGLVERGNDHHCYTLEQLETLYVFLASISAYDDQMISPLLPSVYNVVFFHTRVTRLQ